VIERRLQVPIFESEQDFPLGNALAGDSLNTFYAAFDAATDLGDGAFDGRLPQNDMSVSIRAPGYRDSKSSNR